MKNLQIGERVRYKVGRGWAEGVVKSSDEGGVRIHTTAGHVIRRKYSTVEKVTETRHSE